MPNVVAAAKLAEVGLHLGATEPPHQAAQMRLSLAARLVAVLSGALAHGFEMAQSAQLVSPSILGIPDGLPT